MKTNDLDGLAFSDITDSLGGRYDLNGAIFGGFDQMPALSHELVIADQNQALESFGSLPLDIHFDPSMAYPVLAYDPSLIQSDFDPFDLSEFVDADG